MKVETAMLGGKQKQTISLVKETNKKMKKVKGQSNNRQNPLKNIE